MLDKAKCTAYWSLIYQPHYLLYKCPEEHRFQAAGNERKKERILIERMKEKKKKREKEGKKNPGKLPGRSTISYINVQKSTDFKPQEMKERKKEL